MLGVPISPQGRRASKEQSQDSADLLCDPKLSCFGVHCVVIIVESRTVNIKCLFCY